MRSFDCDEFQRYVEVRTEGERRPEAELHLRGCPNCQSVMGDLEAIRAIARDLSTEEIEPPPHVWTALRAQLDQEGLIHAPGWPARVGNWLRDFSPALPRPVLAGAYILVLAIAGLIAGLHHPLESNDSRWYNGTEARTASLSSSLDSAAQRLNGSDGYDPVVAASLHRNLTLVDNYIKVCEKSVREDPQNEMARDYLYDAYQQKAELLNEISERAGGTR